MAHAEPAPSEPAPKKLEWRWPRFRTSEFVVTAAGVAGAAVGQLLTPDEDKWHTGILFDDDVRGAMTFPTYRQRRAARDASDVLLAALVTYPVLVDGIVVTGWYYQSEDVMWQTFLIDAEVYAVVAALQGLTSGITSRERPYGEDCGKSLDADSRDCRYQSRYRSFFSGHTAFGFAAAGLICSHHANLDLYGGGAADDLTCASAMVAATATGFFRRLSDVHWSSDVIAGGLVGGGIGLTLPWLLHYRTPVRQAASRRATWTLEARPIVGDAWGGALGGRF